MAWDRLLATLPSVQRAVPATHVRAAVRPRATACVSERRGRGERWALLPSAAGVIDPLLSTGFPLTLLGLSGCSTCWSRRSPGPQREPRCRYARVTQESSTSTEQLVAALYAIDGSADRCSSGSACCTSRRRATARRRGGSDRHELAPGFLLHGHPVFGAELRASARWRRRGPHEASRADACSRASIAPSSRSMWRACLDRARGDWYPVRAGDLLAAAAAARCVRGEVATLLERSASMPGRSRPASRFFS